MNVFEVKKNENGKIVDFLDGVELDATPEEFVRQSYLRILHFEYQYPVNLMAREVSIYYGSKELKDQQGHPVRADIVVYRTAKAKANKDQGSIFLVVECKAPNITSGYNQLVSYIFNTSAEGGVWYNGDAPQYYRRLSSPTNELIDWTGIPRKSEAWDALGQRKKEDLKRPMDIKGMLRQCHNKLHGRGVDGDEDDLTMDMVRLILAKAMDEEKSGEYCEFYCTPEEYRSEEGQRAVAKRIFSLFKEVVSSNQDVFSEHEKISVGPRAICDVVIELQRYRLLSDLNESDDWDIMGHAYEQYTATYLKRKRGQFFTNRLVVDFLCESVAPSYQDIILDPAGGSGGFLTGAMRYVRKKILSSKDTAIAKQRQLDKHRTNLFMVEISKRLVKIAKTAMILNGDGHTGMTQGDSLDDISKLNENVLARCGMAKPTVILTNPPFAGASEGRVTDPRVLDNFATGIKWTNRGGEYSPTGERNTEGVPPEMLFFERCLNWIAPGGKIGIVMPKSFLDTQTYFPARKLMFDGYKLLAVVNCHKDTFQPHTGVRTCLLIIERLQVGKRPSFNYPIFLAISKKIGQDSEGFPIFKRDNENNYTDEIDHDFNDILKDYVDFNQGSLVESEYRFSINRSEIDPQLRINPQFYLPNLNETIRQIESIDGIDGWSVTTLGQITSNVKIFKGPRLKSENLLVENTGEGIEPYYTPSAVLQEKSESAKLLNVKLASPKQISTINAVRVYRGDIVITRSGTIGRVSYITQRLDGAIVSDDLIRVRIADEDVRFYVYQFLQSTKALNQMLKNEYGAVQQHLEPVHISNMLIPIPDDWQEVSEIVKKARTQTTMREFLEAGNIGLEQATDFLLESLIERGKEKQSPGKIL
ncbi:N-6 DNA methylase [Pseudomonas sp. MH10]|uniref:N-6 DNA methylase n=1 Tax=Pseudomonas sp. MH10 TaxID=3048627 RepID=UPI002AC98F7F|nr:N-6 DNA methylase [Pseudomonas sp. MH10]MEB0040425.1 N-6 DNA methylase [Pseudomonas sp. MH10]WPX61842.1 N-6 DNA methylase [Pseudomonas sp. MH10]